MLEKLKNNRGSVQLLRVISYLLLVTCLMYMVDCIILMTQNVVTSYEASYYAEKVSIQGGILGQDRVLPGPTSRDCNTCLINADFSSRITSTFNYFGVAEDEWSASVVTSDGLEFFIHDGGVSTSTRKTFEYMDVGVFTLTTEWKPRFMAKLWGNDKFLIKRKVPFVIEQIPN